MFNSPLHIVKPTRWRMGSVLWRIIRASALMDGVLRRLVYMAKETANKIVNPSTQSVGAAAAPL